MTGLDNILKEIKNDSDGAVKKILDEAKEKADLIIAEATKKGETLASDIKAEASKKAEMIISRAEAAAELSGKRAVLKEKQSIIGEYINAAKAKLDSLEGDEYFSVLKDIIEKNANGKKGEIILSKTDKATLTADFKKFLDEKGLSISDADTGSLKGCVIDYGSIEENCTFDAMFDSLMEELSDKTMMFLFE